MRSGCAAMYVRVSTGGKPVETQNDAIVRAPRVQGDRMERVYSEFGGGAARRRPELDRLMDDVRHGLIGKLYVYRLDRLSRAGIRATLAIVEELEGHGVEVVSIADGFTVAGPAREVVGAVLAWAAQMERQAISDRISAARVRIQAAGGQWGRPRRKVDLARVRELQSQRKSLREIAMALKVPRSTLHRLLAEDRKRLSAVPKTSVETGPSNLRKTRGKKQ